MGRITLFRIMPLFHQVGSHYIGQKVAQIVVTPDRKHIVVGAKDGIYLIESENLKVDAEFKSEEAKAVFAVGVSADGSTIFSSWIDRSVRSFDRFLSPKSQAKMHSHVVSLHIANSRVYAGCVNGTVVCWNPDGSIIPDVQPLHNKTPVMDLCTLSSGRVACVSDQSLVVAPPPGSLMVNPDGSPNVELVLGSFHKVSVIPGSSAVEPSEPAELLMLSSKTATNAIFNTRTFEMSDLPTITTSPVTAHILLSGDHILLGCRDGSLAVAQFLPATEESKINWRIVDNIFSPSIEVLSPIVSLVNVAQGKEQTFIAATAAGHLVKFCVTIPSPSSPEPPSTSSAEQQQPQGDEKSSSAPFTFQEGFEAFRAPPPSSMQPVSPTTPPPSQSRKPVSPNRLLVQPSSSPAQQRTPSTSPPNHATNTPSRSPSPLRSSPTRANQAVYASPKPGAASFYGFGVSTTANRPQWDHRHQLTFSRDNKLFHPLLRDYFDRPRDFACGPTGGALALNIARAKNVHEEMFAVTHGHHAAVSRPGNNGCGHLTSSTFSMPPIPVDERSQLRRLACGLLSHESLNGFLTTDQSRHASGGVATDSFGRAQFWNDRFQLLPSRDNDLLNPAMREYFDRESPLKTRHEHWKKSE
eukprot:GDKJ01010581.1.p1 GENE.GDKJ01010581.1~~GDKJ01010581.1.p1  ORF type:complete len:638 (+),score=146.39 GDKJ01010581.1:1-1914(+)